MKSEDQVKEEAVTEETPKEETAAETAETEEAENASGEQAVEPQEPEKQDSEETSGEKPGSSQKKKDPRDEKIEELTDRVKRQMAEFENFRKRTEKEKSTMYEMGARDMIEKILPVVDNLERGIAAIPEEYKGTALAEGMEKICKQFQKTLEDAGVKPIEAVGKEFNPDFHNAVMHVDDESLGENVVAEELQKGYLYRDSVVRHSMVKVAN
jgi:molecular chaperone GrpE